MLPTRRNSLTRIPIRRYAGRLIVNADDTNVKHPGLSQFQNKLIERIMLIQNPLILYFFLIPH